MFAFYRLATLVKAKNGITKHSRFVMALVASTLLWAMCSRVLLADS